jgi:hypothetical protein
MTRYLVEQLKNYESKWVALSPDQAQILASGETAFQAKREAEQKGFKDVVLFRVLPFNVGLAPFLLIDEI